MRFALAAAIGASFRLFSPALAECPVTFAAAAPLGAALVVPLGGKADLARHAGAIDAGTRAAIKRAIVGARLAGYSFDKYKSADPVKPRLPLHSTMART